MEMTPQFIVENSYDENGRRTKSTFALKKGTENEIEAVESIRSIRDIFNESLESLGYVDKGFVPAQVKKEIYFNKLIVDGVERASPGYANYKESIFAINHAAFSKLLETKIEDAYHLVFHEFVHLEETTDENVGVASRVETDGDVFNEGLTNLKAKRIFERRFGRELAEYEQVECGLKTKGSLFNYRLQTQLVDNLITALGLDIDDLIKDGIKNKANHRQTIINHFKTASVDFENEIQLPLDRLYKIIYEGRTRTLTQDEQKIVCEVVQEIQNKTKQIYTTKNPQATQEDKQKFSTKFIDYNDVQKQTIFPMAEMCGIKPQVDGTDWADSKVPRKDEIKEV